MKYATLLRRAGPSARARRGRRTASTLAGVALPFAVAALALVASALTVGATFAVGAALVPTTVPTLLVGWVAAVALTFALPLVAVRAVVAVLDRA